MFFLKASSFFGVCLFFCKKMKKDLVGIDFFCNFVLVSGWDINSCVVTQLFRKQSCVSTQLLKNQSCRDTQSKTEGEIDYEYSKL